MATGSHTNFRCDNVVKSGCYTSFAKVMQYGSVANVVITFIKIGITGSVKLVQRRIRARATSPRSIQNRLQDTRKRLLVQRYGESALKFFHIQIYTSSYDYQNICQV